MASVRLPEVTPIADETPAGICGRVSATARVHFQSDVIAAATLERFAVTYEILGQLIGVPSPHPAAGEPTRQQGQTVSAGVDWSQSPLYHIIDRAAHIANGDIAVADLPSADRIGLLTDLHRLWLATYSAPCDENDGEHTLTSLSCRGQTVAALYAAVEDLLTPADAPLECEGYSEPRVATHTAPFSARAFIHAGDWE